MAEIKCIDVSEWQGEVDFKKVKASGINSVILRAGFGRESSQVDAEFERGYKNAKLAGLKVGAYWYSYAVDVADARKEADACLQVIRGKSFELPVFYDMEDASQTEFGKAMITRFAIEFMTELLKAGYKTGIYANANWFENYLDYNKLYGTYYIWLAQYNTEPQFECDIWQYTSSGKVSGVEGDVDMNIIYNEKLLTESRGDETVREELKKGDKGLDVLCLKYILQLASNSGGVSFDMTLGNDTFGEGTETAVKDTQKSFGLNVSGIADTDFVNRLYAKIKESNKASGDVNADGKVNVKDVTDLQKRIAGVEDV